MEVADARAAQKVAQLMGNAVSEIIIGMVGAGQLDQATGVQILERLEARLRTLSRQLGGEDPTQGVRAQKSRCFSIN